MVNYLMCRKFKFILGLVACLSCASITVQANQRFETLKQEVFAEPYTERPTFKVTRKRFGKSGNNPANHLRSAARRTLKNSQDLINFKNDRKLLQANGICFAGQWVIDQSSDYSGLFKEGTLSPVIVRASVALGGVLRKDKRAFGMAIKLLPDTLGDEPSLNIFVLNSMGGVVAPNTLDLVMDNQPPLGRIPRWGDIRTALRMKKDLEAADREQLLSRTNGEKIKPQVAFRPVNHIASYQADKVSSPKWFRLSAQTTTRVEQDDFRDELALSNYPDEKIVYAIEVAEDHGGTKESAIWQALGRLTLSESVTSKACDGRLHFQHPTLE